MRRPLWFGRLLQWDRSPEGDLVTAHHGQTHRLTKWRRPAVWHFARHPHLTDEEWCAGLGNDIIGPSLSTNIEGAKRLAETWILADERDVGPGDRAANLISTLTGAGAAITNGLVAYPDHRQARISVQRAGRRDEPITEVGTITPAFNPLSRDITTWHVALNDGTAVAETATYHEACRAIVHADHDDTL